MGNSPIIGKVFYKALGKKKTLVKYPLYLHVIDKETEAQRVEH